MWEANCYGLYQQIMKNIKNNFGDFVLLPMNFGNYTISSRHFAYKNGTIDSRKKTLAENSEFLFDKFCKLAEKIATEAKMNVIIRPHPSDEPKFLKKLLIKHGINSKLVKCINLYDSFPWVSAANILIHNCCTTSLEAAFCGTKVLSFTPSKISLYQDDEINSLFPNIKNYQSS